MKHHILFSVLFSTLVLLHFLWQLAQTAPEPEKAEAAAENVMTVAKDPRYARYLKMVQVVSH